MVRLTGVNKYFRGRQVLKDLSFEVHKGETFVIIGLSGTGKTVTLRHISGLLEPDSGEVRVDGVAMNNATIRTRQRLRQRMGMVFQSGALINWLTVEENVALPLVERREYSSDEIARRVEEKLRLLKVYEARDRMPSEISGGMKKRVSLARALVADPDLILYDEPTSGLDPVMSSVINELIAETQQRFGVTSIVVTHDMESAYFLADRIAMLYQGTIVQIGTPDEIRSSEIPIVQQFISGQMQGPIAIE